MDEPGDALPITFPPLSNGEHAPQPPSDVEGEAMRRAYETAGIASRRLGMNRRQFLGSVCGAAATLLAIQTAARDKAAATGASLGGSFQLPRESVFETAAAATAIAGDEFIFDVQTHLLEYDLTGGKGEPFFGAGFPQARCDAEDPRSCFSIEYYTDLVLEQSDTSLAVLSALPILSRPNPLSIEIMEKARAMTEAACRQPRLLLHGQVNPNVGALGAALDGMAELAGAHPIKAWKVYTHVGPGWRLDDRVGDAFVVQAKALKIPIVCVHKGLSGGSKWASPADVGPAAARHPDMAFVTYHSGYESGQKEGPYLAKSANAGINRLITSIQRAGVKPNRVYAELGSTWWQVMRDPTQAAHVLGKLLRFVGEDNVLWGTDSIWYGSPQGQIQALRAFRISRELQEKHGYPALTDTIKRKILGLNAARLYGVPAVRVGRCA